RGIRKVHDHDSVQPGDVTVGHNLQQEVVPVIAVNDALEFRRGPDDPLAPIAVNTASMPHQLVDLELEALADVRRTGLEIGVEEDAAIAVALAFEAQRHLEIFVILVGLQVSVFFGDGLSVNGSVLDGPLFVPYFDPAAEFMAVEQLDPL